ncbi:Hsp70 family protein [Massilia sp. R2A-15]|uniref:Hsp70 family protein n=1 Tax=Massilia sp. R2A-15 TaxID=3064278 RepID=UPI0027341622|nr:Hsp70 family protein [Massilia sp. R2A-15]WLI91400.1 Hsp70 family protein [Massilia sp. R2A-15]
MTRKRHVVGIDLGTTNTVVAFAASGGDSIGLFDIDQLVAPGEVKAGALLPSLRYHPADGELAPGALQLPWAATEGQVIGTLARKLGAQVPGRLVSSAKSWLSHSAVDRLAPILPWGAPADVPKLSPVDASASYLAHVRAAWNWRFPQAPLEQQEVVLTVPASFDEGARALTLRAAQQAGLPAVRLLEEPQAVFYDWLFRHRANLGAALANTRLVLVCDVGGGTTDFSLIKVDIRDGEPQLTRIGVGKHLMLGGDNMDLVLAHMVEARMNAEEGGQARLSAARLSQLLERCRAAKEELLAAGAPAQVQVTLLGAGAKLIGGARSATLTRDEVARAIVDGFFPKVGPAEQATQRRAGIVEFGLPYASDAAITRHVASFLAQHAAAAREALGLPPGGALPVPDTLLLNGGVFRAAALASRLEDTLAEWRGAPLHLLHNDNPDVAVARGAVAYALAREGLAPKIGGGSPRSYFLVLENDTKAICILPRGSEEGREIVLQDRIFALRLGQPVRFHLVSSIADSGPVVGQVIDLSDGDFVPLPPIATVLRGGSRQQIPVRLATSITEVGTLEMHCVSTDDQSQRWLLEFQLRGDGAEEGSLEANYPLPPNLGEAIGKIERVFGSRGQQVPPKEVRQLRRDLEKLLGGREQWHTPLLRKLFDALLQRARGRRRSAEHEAVWLNLAGFCLRPGFGYALDPWRIEQLWALFEAGVQHHSNAQAGAEWWTLWRRVSGGLDKDAQLRLLDDFAFNVQADKAERGKRPVTLVRGSRDEMMRLAASLERIPAAYKVEVGAWLLDILKQGPDAQALAALGRVGARQPFHGSAHEVVPPDVVADWLEAILAFDWKRVDAAAFAAAHLARMTGDRSRDVPEPLRQRIIERLEASGAAPAWIAMVREAGSLDEAVEQRMLGDSLPPGLTLIDGPRG